MVDMETSCCIVGGGPAGMMLGLLLARSGIDVVVLEKHGDFLRDFRGDTIHPSTLEILRELGLLEAFLQRPHQEARVLVGYVGNVEVPIADFTHLPTHARFMAFMPQWDFLDFIAGHAKRYSTFHLVMQAEVNALLEKDQGFVGVRDNSGWDPRHPCSVDHRSGWTSFDRTATGRPHGRKHRRPDRRTLDAAQPA